MNVFALLSLGPVVLILLGLLDRRLRHYRFGPIWSSKPISRRLSIRHLTNQQKEILRSSGIEFEEPDAETILFNDKWSFVQAKLLLNGEVVDITGDADTGEAIMTFQHIKAVQNGFTTSFSPIDRAPLQDWVRNFNQRKIAKLVNYLLLPVVKKSIAIYYGEPGPRPNGDDQFSISLYSLSDWEERQRSSPHFSREIYDVTGRRLIAELEQDRLNLRICSTLYTLRACDLVDDLRRILNELSPSLILAQALKSVGFRFDPNLMEAAARGTDERLMIPSCLAKHILEPVVQRHVEVYNCAGNALSPVSYENMVHVFLYSSPVGTPRLNPPKQLWQTAITSDDPVFAPSGTGIPLAADNGFIFAEILDRNVYLHLNCVRLGTSEEIGMLARQFAEIANVMKDESQRDNRTVVSRMSERFAQQCASQYRAGGLADGKTNFATVETTFRSSLISAASAQSEYYQVKNSPDSELRGREFDQICALANVESVSVRDAWIVVTTANLYCLNPSSGVKYDIGKFEIQINAKEHTIRWLNQTRRVNGFHAPHVNGEGLACMGNTKELFPMLLKKQEYASVVQIAIAFVETVNVDDNWGSQITNWPRACKGQQ
ncbi:MAG: hypothetical protein SGJ27_20610 [Candidatus Melainabacteria bacterium]|nr:hypothetical protein [Candidatus Melainabacteria bacterium]